MMELKLDELPPKVSEFLYRAGLVTCTAILDTSRCDLLSLGTLTAEDVNQIYLLAAKQMRAREFISGGQLTNSSIPGRWGHLSTGCTALDQLLGGGLVTRGVTELAGHSGAGKTQLCLQLSLTCQLPQDNGGLNAGAVFICTEDRFPSVRLNELIKTFPGARRSKNITFGSNIFVEHIADAVELQQCVGTRLPQLLRQQRIGLVVVDSVAAIYRADYTHAEMVQRARDLRTLARQLHSLANTHHIAVVCINQVSDVRRGEHSVTVPALGLAWANLVTCRLQMFRNYEFRRLQVVFSPQLPQGYCQYKIAAAGVQGILPVVYSQ
ncbi:DNA repair protein XRCC3-like [Macrosteles quadrilineatus]|uniref:DNA repair protein XRCC3-like n=1 Tax=Macrosteles quadrilineatus TaxID=74068 RepID=UPI0023E16E04|nr:DNA repair protein XRCC3-like [Macrosteles quadrilineatus]